jgi:hypothetical protein
MALSYKMQVRNDPALYNWTGSTFGVVFQNSGTLTSGFGNSFAELLTNLESYLNSFFGGSFTITTSTSGSYTVYNIDYTGLTTDPVVAFDNDIVFFVFTDQAGAYASSGFFSQERCVDEGLCPDCPEIDTTPCDICYDVTTDPCESTIFLPGLDADTTYTLTMTDNNAGVSYNYEVTTDETGEASVIIADFPVGAFSTFSNYTVTIVDENGDPAQVTIGYTTYDCYNLIFTPSTTVTPQT